MDRIVTAMIASSSVRPGSTPHTPAGLVAGLFGVRGRGER
jgi:hypothetical protein